MMQLLDFLHVRLGAHLSDEVLSSLISGELSVARSMRAEGHLKKCWQCRSRRDGLEQSARMIVDFRKSRVERNLRRSGNSRELFIARLDQKLLDVQTASWLSNISAFASRTGLTKMNPIPATVVIVIFAALLVFLVWRRSNPITPEEFLARATQADTREVARNHSGVEFQQIRFETPKGTFQRAIYRDIQGKRHQRQEPLDTEQKQIRSQLELAGVSWDAPLSAAGYRDWHDRLPSKRDEVRSSGGDQIVLFTTPEDGAVKSESLAVRASDFHPVARTVQYRQQGTIEIAELNYAELELSAVNPTIFEPLAAAVALSPAPSVALPAPLTSAELDSAELQARLVLNHLNADAGEQIQVSRTGKGIQVKGVVQSEQRKREIVAELRPLPHVTNSILSVEELSTHPSSEIAPIGRIQAYSMEAGSSPLDGFFRQHAFSQDALSSVSKEIVDASLSISREAGSLSDLIARFDASRDLPPSAVSAINELQASHTARLLASLQRQDEVLQQLGFASTGSASGSAAEPSGAELIARLAEQNEALCRELLSGFAPNGSPRTAEAIAADLLNTSARMRAITEQLGTRPGRSLVGPRLNQER